VARQQSNFVSAVSHEFRSPLTSLSHLTSLLRSDFQPSEERRRKYYDVLSHETERLRRFVDTLLDFGRMQAGGTRYRLRPVDVSAFVQGLIDEFKRDAASSGRSVSCTLPARASHVSADADALGRALWNLLENAVKYSPDGAPVQVRVEDESGHVAIRVSDRGVGIPADEQPHVFQQFYRGASAVESATRGTGVGLAVVDHIVRGHGGEVQLVSQPGEGSTFSILLPAVTSSAAAADRRVS
jgi:signal transduction histidine kinase